QLKLEKKIGEGNFGEIFKGIWERNKDEKPVEIAVKRLIVTDESSDEFAREVQMMKFLRNDHLVSLLGISLDPITNQKLMITEFMQDGDLKNWLERQSKLPPNEVLIDYCLNICRGMSYLEKRHYTHCDLACRNVLLRGKQVKIADFGMTRIIKEKEYKIKSLPVRWSAPEVLDSSGSKFTTKSDVFAFGICMIEIWTKGNLPYATLPNHKVIDKVRQGDIHERPDTCPQVYYDGIIKKCFHFEPDARPSFRRLVVVFKAIRSDKFESEDASVKSNMNKSAPQSTRLPEAIYPTNDLLYKTVTNKNDAKESHYITGLSPENQLELNYEPFVYAPPLLPRNPVTLNYASSNVYAPPLPPRNPVTLNDDNLKSYRTDKIYDKRQTTEQMSNKQSSYDRVARSDTINKEFNPYVSALSLSKSVLNGKKSGETTKRLLKREPTARESTNERKSNKPVTPETVRKGPRGVWL
ncbi:unnamed protein product, partial [Didymodactylos carnosus]